MRIKITDYNIICNLGNDINEVFENAVNGINSCFDICDDLIKGKETRVGKVNCNLPDIDVPDYNLRCNQLLLKCFEKINTENLFKKYDKTKIGVVVATTNTGVNEFEYTNNIEHTKISNPASFIKDYYKLENYYTSVSTACSSGIKAFSVAAELLKSGFSDAVIVAGVDEISKVPVFGFSSLEILSNEPSIPFSKNRKGMNLGEGAAVFIVEKDVERGIEIKGIGETTDCYHSTTPDPSAEEAIRAINVALKEANLLPNEIDYINLHGTGTSANDLMEAVAINHIFGNQTPASSTKPLTGHCLGAAASIETALCCKLIEEKDTKLYPHVFDGNYDNDIPEILLAKKETSTTNIKNILCTSFGFGGTNTAIVLGAKNDKI